MPTATPAGLHSTNTASACATSRPQQAQAAAVLFHMQKYSTLGNNIHSKTAHKQAHGGSAINQSPRITDLHSTKGFIELRYRTGRYLKVSCLREKELTN